MAIQLSQGDAMMGQEQPAEHEQEQASFQQRLAAGRRQVLVGREAEMQAFEAMLVYDTAIRLWFIGGPGGIGKTTLLQAFCDLARERGNPFVFVDARDIRPNPQAARHALEQAAGNQPFSNFCDSHATPVLIIDTYEQWQAMECWLRETFLPGLPSNLRVVIAARNPPGSDWQADAGWRSLMQVTTLADLDENQAADYLAIRAVDAVSRDTLIAFSGGRPLVLALGADMAAKGQVLHDENDVRPILESLVARFTAVAETPAQREALDAAAIVREIDASLLACMLGIDDARALYGWLSQLSFMSHGQRGLYPHGLVRRILMQDMPKRCPGRYETHVQRAFDWNVDEIEAIVDLSWNQAARFARDGLYALRELDVVQHFLYPRGARSLYVEPAVEQDWPVLADMVACHEGMHSRAWFEFWWQRAPGSVFVVRDPGAVARGLFMKLDMESLEATDRAADPLTSHLWQRLDSDFGAGPDKHMPFIRFWTTRDYGQSQSPEKTVILSAINSYNLKSHNLRLTAQVFGDSPEWQTQARALGIDHLQGSETRIGDHAWHIYYNDWRHESPTHYYRRFAERCINFDAVVSGARMADLGEPQTVAMERATFEAGLRNALKVYHSDAGMKANTLLGSALVLEMADQGADELGRVRTLRQCLNAAVAALAETGVGRDQARVLRQTYFKGTVNQKQAAASLGIGYSTFRRQLAVARQALAHELWQWELHRRDHQ